MSEIFNRFHLEAAKFNLQLAACLLVVWAAVLACTFMSINSQRMSEHRRRFWILLILCLPFFGVLAYLPFSVRREDLPQLFLMRIQRDRWNKRSKKVAADDDERTV